MGTCRFILTNHAESATVLNTGAGPSPPARTEVAPFVMERAFNADRRSLWKAGAANAGADWQFDIDLGSAKDISGCAVHGISCPGGVITAIGVGYFNSYPGPPIVISGLSLNGRDAGLAFSTFNKRHWMIYVVATAAPVIGRVVLGPLTDLAVAPNPGAESSPYQNRLEQVGSDGQVTFNVRGYPGRDFTFSFDPESIATRDAVEALHAYPGTLTYLDTYGKCFEIWLRGGRVKSARLAADLAAGAFEAARCP